VDLPETDGEANVHLRFGLWSDEDDDVDDGVAYGAVAFECFGPSFVFLDGTSMAAPHVSGVAALLRYWLPAASVAELRAALLNGVDKLAGLNGKVATGGRLNAYGALRERYRRALTSAVTKKPRKRITTRKRKVKASFRLRPRVAEAKLQCKLDKRRWRKC